MKYILLATILVIIISGNILTIVLDFKRRKLAKELYPLADEAKKELLKAPWWKMKALEQDYFLACAYKKYKEEIPYLRQFRILFWVRNFSLVLAVVLWIICEITVF
ncbi:MAG: hypothetical protein FWC42_04280 [Proteobacteria bacterium]|nr:hypothetical protein [Pseudomonadota bacterium]